MTAKEAEARSEIIRLKHQFSEKLHEAELEVQHYKSMLKHLTDAEEMMDKYLGKPG